MNRPTIELHSREGEHGETLLACPGPGRVRWTRLPGEVLVGGSVVGILVRGERRFDLVAPAGTRAQIQSVRVEHPWNECEHGHVLAELVDVTAGGEGPGAAAASGDEGGFLLRSSTHGTFYRRPSPEAPNYVETGQSLDAETVVGLVEVMKCFSPVTFSPPAGATGGVLEEVLVDDGAEVRAEQPLFRIRLS